MLKCINRNKASSSPKRLELLGLLCHAAKTVETLSQEANISVKLASSHLQELKSANLVESRRQGKNVIYHLARPSVANFLAMLGDLAEERLFELQEAVRQMGESAHEWRGTTREELLTQASSSDAIVIDVRPSTEFEANHIPYARSMPLSELKARLKELPKDKTIVAYCRGPFCLLSSDAVSLLRGLGYDAVVLRDGIVEWNRRAS
ncbi:MAG: ArsR family transcriptional regulator [Candidatus Melainabacteria bacterium]|jgi:rhodanese-related sulfurtransferase/predicted transcriptional regulator|nr:ArsR family transcriptional regulator [Candidatus Melainabacteria bacterium]